MSLWDDFVEGAGAAVDWIGDAAEDGIDALADAAEAVEEALDEALDAIADAVEEVGDALADLGADIADIAEEAWDEFEGLADDAWDTVSSGVEAAWEGLSDGIEAAWEAAAAVAEDGWEDLSAFAEGAWSELSEGAEAAWEAVDRAAEAAWERAVAAAEGMAGQLADLAELSVELMDRLVEFIVDIARTAVDLIKKLGACVGGIVILQLAKTDNLVENFWKTPKQLPASFRTAIEPVFGGRSFDNVWYIDDARLAADWYNDETDAMTMSGATLAGVTLDHLIFVTSPWNPQDPEARKLMAHELIHVLQYRRLVTDPSFGCAYGVGFMEAGFDYAKNPMEDSAYRFVRQNETAIV